jgi:hypothetical protein
MMNDPRIEIFYNAETGATTTRELTAEEIAALPEPGEPITSADPE